MTLPARTAVLNEVDKAGTLSVNEAMEILKPIYGNEGQFKKDLFVEHFLSLQANDLVELSKYDLDSNQDLDLYFTITPGGHEVAQKYIPAEYRR
ncbi:hypothetical protein SAMN05421767_10259 [Granulicatella balaenopterae]|uniref:Uncharacterized protein n=1 Tax=Granulicatella balaenopterae TaxID=137733 RepID=A0A1H9HCE5_9LACT|nr:hypothetical protein [Granulicatella balaenopterae]SEQ59957.1 hypothetical protein SAMN05421767_10259 [Granulicatella balaenopterae]